MAFTVIYQRKAQRELDEALAWWSRHGKSAAAQWRERFLETVVAALEDDPHRFPLADEAPDSGIDLRMMLYGRRRQVYRILFTIDGDKVFIHHVRHAARDRLTAENF